MTEEMGTGSINRAKEITVKGEGLTQQELAQKMSTFNSIASPFFCGVERFTYQVSDILNIPMMSAKGHFDSALTNIDTQPGALHMNVVPRYLSPLNNALAIFGVQPPHTHYATSPNPNVPGSFQVSIEKIDRAGKNKIPATTVIIQDGIVYKRPNESVDVQDVNLYMAAVDLLPRIMSGEFGVATRQPNYDMLSWRFPTDDPLGLLHGFGLYGLDPQMPEEEFSNLLETKYHALEQQSREMLKAVQTAEQSGEGSARELMRSTSYPNQITLAYEVLKNPTLRAKYKNKSVDWQKFNTDEAYKASVLNTILA